MYKYILESIENINWLAIIPLVIFFIFFVAMTYNVYKYEKGFINKMGGLPLEDDGDIEFKI